VALSDRQPLARIDQSIDFEKEEPKMFEFLKTLTILVLIGGGLFLGMVFIGFLAMVFKEPEKKPDKPNHPAPKPEDAKGDENMLPQHLWEQISKIIEENAGIKIPRYISPAEILESIPAKDRAKLFPTLIPIVVEAIRASTGMKMEASITLEEFLLGQGLGLTELDVAIESDAMKLDKTLAGRKRYKEIVDHYKEELGEDATVDFVEKMFLYKLLQETFKDIQLPPGWSPQQVAGLMPRSLPKDDGKPLQGEIVNER
jgi:hypothetical protein